MRIGIIAAMNKELELMLPMLQGHRRIEHEGFTFHDGTIGTHDVVMMQCGIGKVNAAMGTMAMISHFAPHKIINSGVAGGADKRVSVMDVVAGERVAYHDVWCGPECELGKVQGLPLYYRGDESLLALLPQRPDVKPGLICSGDQFIDKIEAVEAIKNNFPDALAVDMESGAIAQVCHVRQVPFLSLRVISDSPGASHDNTAQYVDFWSDAPQHTFALVKNLLSSL